MSTELPHLSTPRLLLRALEPDQAEVLSTLANGPKIADNTANIPVPYTLETAQLFIAGNLLGFATVRDDWERRL